MYALSTTFAVHTEMLTKLSCLVSLASNSQLAGKAQGIWLIVRTYCFVFRPQHQLYLHASSHIINQHFRYSIPRFKRPPTH